MSPAVFSVMKRTEDSTIKAWLNRGLKIGAAYVIVKVDMFSLEAYPVMVMPGKNVKAIADNEDDNTETSEVYNLSMNFDAQLAQDRAWNV